MISRRWIPNFLTLARLSMALPLAVWLWQDRIWLSLALLVVAGATDLLDGFLARALNARTKLGAWLDPTADKVMVVTVLITLTAKGVIPVWFCLFTLGRDVGLLIGILVFLLRGQRIKVHPPLTGKIAVAVQNMVLLLAIASFLFPPAVSVLSAALIFSAVLTLVSAVNYGRAARSFVQRTVAEEAA